MEVIVVVITLVLVERALCVGLYDSAPTYYYVEERRWLDVLFRTLKFLWAFSLMLVIGAWPIAFLLMGACYGLAFILKNVVFKWIRKNNGE